ncbi:MAG TPA: ectonucleotide pyrophosphatase/phosphodiesterase, partial [Opitutales bacterium]|nr:ectonucleotide pyrophosphatase/phosphodiesterase [Opitutales bacterium]
MPASICSFWGGCLFLLLPLATPPTAAETFSEPTNTVLWISLDGFRPDYLEKAETPFLNEMLKKSAWTDDLWPVFPSVTFPSHVSIATGTYPQEHGIVGNTFYDLETDELHRFPNSSELLEAEPIWITAERQDVRTAVFGWPLSYAQTGDITATYCAVTFDGSLTDKERLEQTAEIFETNQSLR